MPELLILALVGFITVRAVALPSDRQLLLFADTYHLDLTDEIRPVLARAIQRARVFRVGFGLLGWVAAIALRSIGVSSFRLDNPFFAALIGYGIGAILAEVTVRPPRSAKRSATLAPRRGSEYVRPLVLWLEASLVVGVTAGLAATQVWPGAPLPSELDQAAQLHDRLGDAAGLSTLGLSTLTVRWLLIRRAQHAEDSTALQAEDAMRRASINAVTFAGLASLLSAASLVAAYLGQVHRTLLATTLNSISFIGGLAAAVAFVAVFSTLPRFSWSPTTDLRRRVTA